MKRRLVRGDDSGAALIFVLLIVTVVAIMLGALMSFADTSTRTTVAMRAEASSAYSADGAMQAAINNIRNSTFNGAAGQTCFSGGNTLTVPYGSGSAAVTCTPDPAQIKIQCTSLTQCNRPGNAILTLGKNAGEDGINVQQNTGSTFRVHGTVFSQSNINVVNGTMSTNTGVYANSGCAGNIQSNPPPSCTGNTGNSLGADPGYASLATKVPAYQPVPQCPASGNVVTFQPGYYDDAAALNSLMSSSSKCGNDIWWFTPGVYYFDFHNAGLNSDPLLNNNNGKNQWQVSSGYLIGGTRTSAGTAYPPSIPGACYNPIDNINFTNPYLGVQFIFGNDSQLMVSNSAQAEICGTYDQNNAPVTIYGQRTGSETTTQATGLNATSVTPGDFSNATTTSLGTIENTYTAGNYATWTVPNGKSNAVSGQVTLGGFTPSPTIPAGSILQSATLHVGHRYKPKNNNKESTPTVAITPSGGGTINVNLPLYNKTYPAGQKDDIDVTGALAQSVHDSGFSGASLVYTANAQPGDVEDLDGIQLDLTYIAPAFRAESGCITATPYTSTGNKTVHCAVVTTQNSGSGYFYVQGTMYTPNAAVDLSLNNSTQQIFRFGVIARSLWVSTTGSFSFPGPVIGVPDDQPGFVFSVFLTGYVCPTSPTCDSGTGTKALSSRVAYIDGDPTHPQAGQRQVSVLSWSSNR